MEIQARQTAVKARISSLINGQYVVQQGWEPNYILHNKEKISRVNVIGVIVSKAQSEFSNNKTAAIDDGSGRISIRTFDESSVLDKISVGQIVILIGRPREYGNEVYITPEIIQPLQNKRWAEIRQMELKLKDVGDKRKNTEKEQIEKQQAPEKAEEADAEKPQTDRQDEEEAEDPESIISLIRRLDTGEGADYSEIISSGRPSAENSIINLLKNGEIFEIKPGKLKVLE